MTPGELPEALGRPEPAGDAVLDLLCPPGSGVLVFVRGEREDHWVAFGPGGGASVHAVLLPHSHGDHIGAIDIYESAALVGMAADAPLLEEQGEGELDLDVALEATPCSPTAARTSS